MLLMRLGETSLRVPVKAEYDARFFVENPMGWLEMNAFLAAAQERRGIFLDIGGHRGLFSAMFCATYPDNHSYCFEPSPMLADAARRLAADNSFLERLTVIESALGEQPGEQTMLLDPVGGFVQAKRFKSTMWGEPVPVTLRIETVDRFCEDRNATPTVVKIDVEGYEVEVLRGARRVLTRDRPYIFIELHLNYLAERGLYPREVVSLIQESGYQFKLLDGRPVSGDDLYDCPLDRVHFIATPT
jgi:FkbM family methyltransferase